jgi:transcription antitermination protein NusB
MISRRQIRIKVMQAIYAWYCTGDEPATTFDINLREFADEIREFERRKGDKGDSRLLMELFYDTIKNGEAYDQLIQSKAENWELERIALIDRILMQMGISEMTHFEEIPIKVTINEYLEIAKKFSTPKSSKFINGILDSLYIQFKQTDKILKTGRGLIEESLPKRKPAGFGRGPGMGGNQRPLGPPRDSGGQGGYGGNHGGYGGGQGHSRPQDNSRNYDEQRNQGGPRHQNNENQPPFPDNQGSGGLDDKKKRPRIRKNDNDNA